MNTIEQQDWVGKWATYRPEKVAIKAFESGKSLTYATLHRLGNRLAHAFTKDLLLQKGDRVAVLAENCLEYLILFAAAQKTGIILVPLNYRLATAELDYLLQTAAPQLLITAEKFREKWNGKNNIPHHWSMQELRERCNPAIAHVNDQHFELTPVAPDDPIFILFTSGTTGFPKGALYTHQMLFWNSINTAMSLIIHTESRTVNCMPPFHTGGWNVLMTPFLHHGAFTCLMRKFDPEAVLKSLEQEQVTIFMGVPTMLKMMAELPEFESTDLRHLHYMIVGGEPMPIPLIERYEAKGVAIRQGYGMTEVGPNLTSLHQDDAIRKKGSIGRANFYVQTQIVDADGKPVKTNEVGELLLKGPMVTPGYWQNPEATRKAIKDGWFCSGDLVRQDEEGHLFVVDRIKNMYISGGENVYPAEVERVLQQHPAVSEAAVIAVPDVKWGEAGCAFVVSSPGQAVEEASLLAFCKEHLANFKVPKKVHFLKALPKNDTGKINRIALKELT